MTSPPHTIDITAYGTHVDTKNRAREAAPTPVVAIPAAPRRTLSFFKLRSELLKLGYIYRSEVLTLVYLGTALASPLGDANPLIGEILALLTLAILLAGASYMVSRKIACTVIIPITALWLVARTVEALGYRHTAYTQLSPVFGLVLSIAVLAAILRRLSAPPLVTTGVIAEAFIGYLTLATAFGQLYWMLNHFLSAPFNQIIPESHLSTLLYFSMITLTSVGYGGIAPINPYLRLVAALESMLGIFYVAVVVARLASSYRANRKAWDR